MFSLAASMLEILATSMASILLVKTLLMKAMCRMYGVIRIQTSLFS